MKNNLKRFAKGMFFVSVLLGFILLINKLIFIFSTLNRKLYDGSSRYYQWKFGKIHYTVSGTGKALLCIHSLTLGASAFEYNKLIHQLSKTHTVYCMDLLGYGKSEKPKITYTAYLYVQLINDFIKNVIQEETDVLTSGSANSFVTISCLQEQSFIDRLVFINPTDLKTLSRNPRKKDVLLKRLIELPILGTSIYLAISSRCLIKRVFEKNFYFNRKNVAQRTIQAFYDGAHLGEVSNKYIYSSNRYFYTSVNIKNALQKINNSIYLIQGQDRLEVSEDYKVMNASIESSTIFHTKEFPHLENPKAVLEVLSLFLN